MFPKAKKSKVDTEALGAMMLKRKMALMNKMGLGTEEDGGEADAKPKRAAKR